MPNDQSIAAKLSSRWKFHPWGSNSKAICERLQSLIAELRLAEVRASDTVVNTSSFSTKALLAAIRRDTESVPDLQMTSPDWRNLVREQQSKIIHRMATPLKMAEALRGSLQNGCAITVSDLDILIAAMKKEVAS